MTQSKCQNISDFRADVYSQMGEDGIIQKILEVIPDTDKWCVEFGAWDGMHLSNTRRLIEANGYSAVLIEGSRGRFEALKKNYSRNDRVIAVHGMVGFAGDDSLDEILAKTPIPQDFDFVSIDIDGNDYHVWDAMLKYRPKVVCIEFNPTIPNEVSFVQAKDFAVNQGSSILALVDLAKRKGYELVSALAINAFFVRSDYFELFAIEDNSVAKLRTNLEYVTYLFSTYDGKIMLRGNKKLLWHGLELSESKLQHIPFVFQRYPGTYGPVRSALYRLYLAAKHRGAVARRILRWLQSPDAR